MGNRLDPPVDPFTRDVKTREPARLESTPTHRATEPEQHAAVRVYGDTNQTTAAATPEPLEWNQESFDTHGLHSTTSNIGRITIPTSGKITGLWAVHCFVTWQNLSGAPITADFILRVSINGALSGQAGFSRQTLTIPNNGFWTQEVLMYVRDPNAGTVFEAEVENTVGVMTIIKNQNASFFEAFHLW